MNNCTECKNFLDINSITDNTSYRKWMLLNHPDKFRKFGNTDSRYINATEHTKKASDCFPKWYGTGSQKICGTFGDLDIPTTFEKKNSLLLDASRTGDIRIVKELIALGGDVNIQNSIGETALSMATSQRKQEIIDTLTGEKKNQMEEGFVDSLTDNRTIDDTEDLVDWIRELVSDGENLNIQDSNGSTYLMLNITGREPDIKIVIALIKGGVNVNTQDNYGNTALMYSSIYTNVEIVNALIKAGAKLDLQNKRGGTALLFACSKDRVDLEIVNALIQAGADVNLQDNYEETALDKAIRRGNQEIIDILKKAENKQIRAQKKAFYMSTILGDRLPREKNSISGLFSGIGYNPYIARHIADYAFGEGGAEESKSNREDDDDGGRRRKKSKSTTRKSIRKKSRSKRRKSIRKKSKSKKSKRRKSNRK